jgi:hypothetical protein
MFKELRAHLATIEAQSRRGAPAEHPVSAPVAIKDIPPSLTVKSLQS